MRRTGVLIGLLVGLVIGLTISAVPAVPGGDSASELPEELVRPLAWLIEQVDQHYVEDVELDELVVGAYQGMLSRLDRYCVYWPPEMVDEFQADVAGEFGGLGIQITFDPVKKALTVEQPIPGTPAARKGVLAGDLILDIRQGGAPDEVIKVEDFETVHDAVKVLRGEPGTKVTITVLHTGTGERESITIKREIIHIPGVRAVELIDPERRIGYVYIPYFSRPLVRDLTTAIADLEGQGAEGLILDMRLNPGGLLQAAEDCADLFLAGGTIVEVKGRYGPEQTHQARRRAPFGDIPLVLLVNRYSASGAEIVAAALRDHGRARLVGEKTFGKASVQTVIGNPTIKGSAIKLTIARYYTPEGQLIEGEGIAPEPEDEVVLSDEETRRLARSLSRKVDYPPRLPEEGEEGEGNGEDEEEEPFEDTQLQRARQVLAELMGLEAAAPVAAGEAGSPQDATAPARAVP